MTLLDVQRRFTRIGEIRLGEKVAAASGKSRPRKLETFRLTSKSLDIIKGVAERYGGSVEAWEDGDGYQVITDAASLEIMLPPLGEARPYTLSYELWSGGGLQRRCDGVNAVVAQGETMVEHECVCDPDARECKPTLRVNVFLADVPGFGVWRLSSTGFNAAAELPGMLELLAQFAASGRPVRAILRLEQRTSKKGGRTHKFAVPVLDLPYSLAELTGGALAQLPTNGAAKQLTSSPTAVVGEAPSIPRRPTTTPQPAAAAPDPDDRPDRPIQRLMPLDKPLEGEELQRWRAGTHAAMRARIDAAADEHEALRQVAEKVIGLGDRSLNDLTLGEWRTLAAALRELPIQKAVDGADETSASTAEDVAVESSAEDSAQPVTPAPASDDLPFAEEDPAPASTPPASWEVQLWEVAKAHGIHGWEAINDVAGRVFPDRDLDELPEADWLVVAAEIATGKYDTVPARPTAGARS